MDGETVNVWMCRQNLIHFLPRQHFWLSKETEETKQLSPSPTLYKRQCQTNMHQNHVVCSCLSGCSCRVISDHQHPNSSPWLAVLRARYDKYEWLINIRWWYRCNLWYTRWTCSYRSRVCPFGLICLAARFAWHYRDQWYRKKSDRARQWISKSSWASLRSKNLNWTCV